MDAVFIVINNNIIIIIILFCLSGQKGTGKQTVQRLKKWGLNETNRSVFIIEYLQRSGITLEQYRFSNGSVLVLFVFV